jgi:hypothetical protein
MQAVDPWIRRQVQHVIKLVYRCAQIDLVVSGAAQAHQCTYPRSGECRSLETGKATFEPHVNTLKHGPPILFGIGRILKGRAPYDLVSPLHVARSALRGAFR